MPLDDATETASGEFASACAGAECGGSTFWQEHREADILRVLQPSHSDPASGLLAASDSEQDDCSCNCSPESSRPIGPDVPPGPPDWDAPPLKARWWWWWWWQIAKGFDPPPETSPDPDPPPEPDRTKPWEPPGAWAQAMAGLLNHQFGVMPRGYSLASRQQFAGTPGFGIAPAGTLVGQSMSTFVGGVGFGFAPAGTTLGSNLTSFAGSSGFGIWGTGQFGNTDAYDTAASYRWKSDHPRLEDLENDGIPPPPRGDATTALFASIAPQDVPDEFALTSHYCGPIIDTWLTIEAWNWYMWGKSVYRRNLELIPRTAVSATIALVQRGLIVKHVAPQMLYKLVQFNSDRCPTAGEPCGYEGTAAGTATLSGRCIDTSEIGNFLFGVFATAMGIPDLLAFAGAAWANRHDTFTDQDKAAIELGQLYSERMGRYLNKKKAGDRSLLLAPSVRGFVWRKIGLFSTMLAEPSRYCAPCPDRVDSAAKSNHVRLPDVSRYSAKRLSRIQIALPKEVR